MAHSLAGLRFTELVLQLLRIHGDLVAAADLLVTDLGLTSARWQVLSRLRETPSTVSRVARRMDLSRQGVQRLADRLVADGFLEVQPNPDHKQSPLLHVTPYGEGVLEEARRRQEAWAHGLSGHLEADDLAVACRVLGGLSDLLASVRASHHRR
jgi:DNA-binding MarR family transcriptional regulator